MIIPPEFISLYENCSCCGSGSGSGSSPALCACKYLVGSGSYAGLFQSCAGSPVWDNCITDFVATVRLNYSNCGSIGFGSCGSVSGLQTGVADGDTASGSAGSCPQTCPDCCDYFPDRFEFSLKCRCIATGNPSDSPTTCMLMSTNLLDPTGPCKFDGSAASGSGSCFGYRADKCPYFVLSEYSLAYPTGARWSTVYIPFDNAGGMYGEIRDAAIVSCNPVQISGDIWFYPWPNPFFSPCYAQCAETNPGGLGEPNCIRGTFTITEALP